MSDRLGELDLEQAAAAAAGNWQKFDCFVWFRESDLDDAENWAVIYTHHRDSGLLDESNSAAIAKALGPFSEQEPADVVFESHSHWAVGHIDGLSIRVFREGKITEAFNAYHALAQRLADYPILDETDYSRREVEATLSNLPEAAWRLKHDFELPDDWPSEVYGWLSNHRPSAVDNTDDCGGYPKESDLKAAFAAIGYERRRMSTILSNHFKNRRLGLGLRPGAVARLMGYRSIVGAANKICQFEQTGNLHAELFAKLAEVLNIDTPTIERLVEEDRRAAFETWAEWSNVPIRPHLIIKLIPGIFGTNEIPDAILGDQKAMERFAADLARRAQKRIWLVLSRRLSIVFDELGHRVRVEEASPGEPNGPYMRLKGSRKKFLFDEDFKVRITKSHD